MKTLKTVHATTRRTFSIISPGIKLCDQQSFRTSDFKENVINRVAKLSKHHTLLLSRREQWLLLGSRGGGGIGLRRLNQVEDRLGQSAHEDVEDARFESGRISGPENVASGDGKNNGDKGTHEGKEVNPGRGAALGCNFLADGVEGRAANIFCPQDFQPAF